MNGTWGLSQFVWKAQGQGGAGEGMQLAKYATRGRVCDPAVLLEEKSVCTGKLGSDQGSTSEIREVGSRARGPPWSKTLKVKARSAGAESLLERAKSQLTLSSSQHGLSVSPKNIPFHPLPQRTRSGSHPPIISNSLLLVLCSHHSTLQWVHCFQTPHVNQRPAIFLLCHTSFNYCHILPVHPCCCKWQDLFLL